MEEIQRLTARTNELKNDESILKLTTSPDMASTSKDNSRMIKSKPTEPTEFKDQLSSKQTTLEEKEATYSNSTLSSPAGQKVVDDKKVRESRGDPQIKSGT